MDQEVLLFLPVTDAMGGALDSSGPARGGGALAWRPCPDIRGGSLLLTGIGAGVFLDRALQGQLPVDRLGHVLRRALRGRHRRQLSAASAAERAVSQLEVAESPPEEPSQMRRKAGVTIGLIQAGAAVGLIVLALWRKLLRSAGPLASKGHVITPLALEFQQAAQPARGKAPPPPKGPGPPPPKRGPPVPLQPGSKAAPMLRTARRQSAADMPFGQRIHLVGAAYDMPGSGTVFGELGLSHEESRLDPQLITAIFTPPVGNRAKAFALRAVPGITVFDAARAQNLAIPLNRLRMSTAEICEKVQAVDFSGDGIDMDDIELVSACLPTSQEATKLMAQRDKVDLLRDVERKVLPLCTMSSTRLRVMKVALSHSTAYASILERCRILLAAAEEARSSVHFKELLGVTLQIGNFINHGVVDSAEGTVRGFAIESLHVLASFKKGGVSALHGLCLTMRTSGSGFLQELKDSLRHIHQASRERTNMLQADVRAFGENLRIIQQFVGSLPPEEEEREETEEAVTEEEEDRLEENEIGVSTGGDGEAAPPEVQTVKVKLRQPLLDGKGSSNEVVAGACTAGSDAAEAEAKQGKDRSEPSSEAKLRRRMRDLCAELEREDALVREALDKALLLTNEVQTYFSVNDISQDQLPPPEQFFAHIASFMLEFQAHWMEIASGRGRWRQLESRITRGAATRGGSRTTAWRAATRKVTAASVEKGKKAVVCGLSAIGRAKTVQAWSRQKSQGVKGKLGMLGAPRMKRAADFLRQASAPEHFLSSLPKLVAAAAAAASTGACSSTSKVPLNVLKEEGGESSRDVTPTPMEQARSTCEVFSLADPDQDLDCKSARSENTDAESESDLELGAPEPAKLTKFWGYAGRDGFSLPRREQTE